MNLEQRSAPTRVGQMPHSSRLGAKASAAAQDPSRLLLEGFETERPAESDLQSRSLCACGCGERVITPGSTWRSGHKRGRRNKTGFVWIEGLHYEVADTGCWEWLMFRSKAGYGWNCGMAHRRGYESLHGVLPEHMHVHHVCENPGCVNPEHMEVIERPEHLRRHKQAASHLTEADIVYMREARAAGATLQEIAERFNTTYSNVGYICRGKSWPNAGGPIEQPSAPCLTCGESFVQWHPSKRYCSESCKATAYNERRRVA